MGELDFNLIEKYANGETDEADVLRHDILNLEQLIANLKAAQTVRLDQADIDDEENVIMNMTFVFECGFEDDYAYEFEVGDLDKAQDLLELLKYQLAEIEVPQND